jgi:flavin-dependent dehydrogenase
VTDPLRVVDVAIVGAGTTGAAAALLCARRGLDVVCLERGALGDAGAHWVNGVSASAFDAAEIARPEPPERLAMGVDFHLLAGWGPERVVIRDHDLMEVDMRLLVERLQHEASTAGAEFIDHVRVEGVNDTGLRDASLSTSRGPVEARWVVDASGLTGARLLDHACPAPGDICAAAQGVHHVSDFDAASRFVHQHGADVGETICFSGIEGGYSILNLRVDGAHVSLLTGSIPSDGHRSGRQILADFVADTSWIGEPIFGGSRAIPIRRPYARLFEGRVCALGDAACQVFAAHGSGIGAGMVAAKILADALAEGRGLQGYATDWQRRYGGVFGAYALFRQFTQSLGASDIEALMRSGLMDADMAADALLGRIPRVGLTEALQKLIAISKVPRLTARLAPTVARMGAAQLLYAAYPHSPKRLAGWEKLCDALLGPTRALH